MAARLAGLPVPAALTEDWARRGVTLRSTYGISEAGACVTITPPGEPAAGPGDVGLPVWHLRCRVADAGGRVCAPGEPGELQIAGASVTPGYWGRPEETAKAVPDGWLRTRLAAFKVPRDIHLASELPRNATGKILKADLRRRCAGETPNGPAAGL